MELYKSEQEFHDAVIATSNYFKVSPAIVEKDYFVTIVLKSLKEKIAGILFKGGTSLSKCFKVINRFSEDIDLTFKNEIKRLYNIDLILEQEIIRWYYVRKKENKGKS